jgi:hypothetical protein
VTGSLCISPGLGFPIFHPKTWVLLFAVTCLGPCGFVVQDVGFFSKPSAGLAVGPGPILCRTTSPNGSCPPGGDPGGPPGMRPTAARARAGGERAVSRGAQSRPALASDRRAADAGCDSPTAPRQFACAHSGPPTPLEATPLPRMGGGCWAGRGRGGAGPGRAGGQNPGRPSSSPRPRAARLHLRPEPEAAAPRAQPLLRCPRRAPREPGRSRGDAAGRRRCAKGGVCERACGVHFRTCVQVQREREFEEGVARPASPGKGG